MGKKNHGMRILLLVALAALGAAALVTSCGGGGGGGAAQNDAALTAANSGAAASAVAQALALLEPSISTGDLVPAGVSAKAPLDAIIDRMRAMSGLWDGPQAQGSMHDSGPCTGGGSATVDASWTGPDQPAGPHEMVNLQMTISASNCSEYPYTMNGTLTLKFSGPLDTPTGFTLSASSAHFVDALYPFDFSMSGFSMALTGITYSGGSIIGGTATLNGSVSGNVAGEALNEGFQNFHIAYSEITGGAFSYDLSGRMRASCLGGWVTVSTPATITGQSTDECPTDGALAISSAGDTVEVLIASDYSMSVYYNGALVHSYAHCGELTGVCSAP